MKANTKVKKTDNGGYNIGGLLTSEEGNHNGKLGESLVLELLLRICVRSCAL